MWERGQGGENPDGGWARVRQGEEVGPKQVEALVAPQNKQRWYTKSTLESRETKEVFLRGSAGLFIVDMVEPVSN